MGVEEGSEDDDRLDVLVTLAENHENWGSPISTA